MKFIDALPDFYKEVEGSVRKENLTELLEQLPGLEITSRCGCGDDFCSTFYVNSARKLNIVEQNIIGSHYGKSIPLDLEGTIVIDVDNFGRITGFEVLYRSDVEKLLNAICKRKIS